MPISNRPPLPEDLVDTLNAQRGGFNELIGLRFTQASYDAVEAELNVTSDHHQPFGLVHGGVFAAIVETLASTAAAIQSLDAQTKVVGLENTTSFLKATRAGVLRARATPLSRGRRTQVWEVAIENDDGKRAAQGRVRLLAVDAASAP